MATVSQLLGAAEPQTPGGSGGPPPGRPAQGIGITDVLPWTLPVLGMAFSKYVKPSQVTAYRTWLGRMAHEAESYGGYGGGRPDWISKLMRAPWWHGGSDTAGVPEHGFSPERVGSNMQQKFGEPHGISLSSRPTVAKGFNTGKAEQPIVRVWPNVDPHAVLPAWKQEAGGPLHQAYLEALEAKVPKIGGTVGQRLSMRAQGLPGGFADPQQGLEMAIHDLRVMEPHTVDAFNRALSQALGKQGIQALLMNPNRYNEHEMRILDMARAIPMELREFIYGEHAGGPLSKLHPKGKDLPYEWVIPSRYNRLSQKISGKFLLDTPRSSSEGPVHLKDLYREIDPARILQGVNLPPKPAGPKQSWSQLADKLVDAVTKPWYATDKPSALAELHASLAPKPWPKPTAPPPAALPKGVMSKGWMKLGGKDLVKAPPEHAAAIEKAVMKVFNNKKYLGTAKPGSNIFWVKVANRLIAAGNQKAGFYLLQTYVK